MSAFSSDFLTRLKGDQERIEAKLADCLSGANSGGNNNLNSELLDAMRYAALGGGKRLRAFLVYESSRICGLAPEAADAGAEAIELMHAYSLVHDDLPSMDDDDERRGKPSLHVKWNEWAAILAGDALQSLAFEVLAAADIPAKYNVDLILKLAGAAGCEGMAGGQFADLEMAGGKLGSLEEVEAMFGAKTGALFSWAAEFGARATGRSPTQFGIYARHLGMAFQIRDDLLDFDEGKDMAEASEGEANMVTLIGAEAARKRAEEEARKAKAALAKIPNADGLKALADFAIIRKY